MYRSRRAQSARAIFYVAARVSVIGAALLGAGCASNQASNEPPAHLAGPHGGPAMQKVEIEEDGLPAQLAPQKTRPIADDPREPWSRNYGTVPTAKRTARAEPVSETTKRRAVALANAMAEASSPGHNTPSLKPDEIIRYAIAAHEMRGQD